MQTGYFPKNHIIEAPDTKKSNPIEGIALSGILLIQVSY